MSIQPTWVKIWRECDRKGVRYKSLWWYARQQTKFNHAAIFFLVIAVWVIQEMILRDLLPETRYPKWNHLMNITERLAAAFVTGFTFYWFITFLPKMRRDYPRRIDLELDVIHVLSTYRDFVMETLYGQQRIPREGNIFHLWEWDQIPDEARLMAAIRPNANEDLDEKVDPFAERFRMVEEHLKGIINRIPTHGIDVPEELRPFIPMDGIHGPMSSEWAPEQWPAEIRIHAIEDLLREVSVYYSYVHDLVFSHSNVTMAAEAMYDRISYRSVWDDLDEQRAFQIKLRELYPRETISPPDDVNTDET